MEAFLIYLVQCVNMKEMKLDGVRVLVYENTAYDVEYRPALIFIHGGGWLGGNPGK